MVSGRRAVDLNPLGVHVCAQQGHVIFPADYRAQTAVRRVENGQGRSVTISPDQALRRRRHHFAMFAQKRSIWREEEHAAIECAALAFNHPNHQINRIGSGGFAERVYIRARNFHRTFKVSLEVLPALIERAPTTAPKSSPRG